MAKVLVTDTNLTNIANAIRGKNGETISYKVDEMAEAINEIATGSSVETVDGSIYGSTPLEEIEVTCVNQDFEIVTASANGDIGLMMPTITDQILKNSILVTSGATYNQFIGISGGITKIYNSSTLCVWKVTGDFSLDFEL